MLNPLTTGVGMVFTSFTLKYSFMKKLAIILAVLCVSFTYYSCKKSDSSSSGSAQMSMRLTDGPSSYDAVYLDIQQVAITTSGSAEVTLTPVRAGVYNILQFKNGLDTLLVRASIPAGTVSQIRLILGSNNSVVISGTSYPLTTPSGQSSGVKLNLHQTLVANGAYTIWIDFDAGASVVATGSGKYMLKPVIRAYDSLSNGQIKGYVLPLASFTTVYAINGTDTFTAIPSSSDGFFSFNGLVSGSYNLWFNAGVLGFSDTTMTGVNVSYGVITNVGTITLHP